MGFSIVRVHEATLPCTRPRAQPHFCGVCPEMLVECEIWYSLPDRAKACGGQRDGKTPQGRKIGN